MMGVTHYATGVCAGACVAWGVRAALVPAPAPAPYVLVGVLLAVFVTWLAGRAAYWPDFDHGSSSATKKLGLVTQLVHELVELASVRVFDATATERDLKRGDFRNHRGLTHFGVTALLVGTAFGVAVWALTRSQPSLMFGLLNAALLARLASSKVRLKRRRGKKRNPRTLRRVRSLVWVATFVPTAFVVTRWVPVPDVVTPELAGTVLGVGVGVAVATGMLAHDLGDAATKAGVPLLWPIPIRGQRYYPIHIRAKENRSRTGADSPTETRLRFWSWAVTAVAVVGWIPGLYLLGLQRVLDLIVFLT